MDSQSSGSVTKVRRGRGKWNAADRERMVAESLRPGASVSEVAQRHGVRPNLLTAWRRKAAVNAAPPSGSGPARFTAIRVNTGLSEGVIEIDLSSGCVRVRGIVEGAMLREVLAAVR